MNNQMFKIKRLKVRNKYQYTLINSNGDYVFKKDDRILVWDKNEIQHIKNVVSVFGNKYVIDYYSNKVK